MAFPLVLPMGWVNSPPAFCAATETSADIANAFIQSGQEPQPHPLDDMASKAEEDTSGPKDEWIPNITRDPCLPKGLFTRPLEYIDMFVDDFFGICTRQTILEARKKDPDEGH